MYSLTKKPHGLFYDVRKLSKINLKVFVKAPSYITELLTLYKPKRSLRSASQKMLEVPKSNTKSCGDRSFSVAAAKLWNALPLYIK